MDKCYSVYIYTLGKYGAFYNYSYIENYAGLMARMESSWHHFTLGVF